MDFTLIKKNLEALGYTVSCFDTAKDATLYLENTIKNKSIGFGGTMTAKEMGLYDILGKNNG